MHGNGRIEVMFQTFPDPLTTESEIPVSERVALLRAELANENLDAFLVPRADEYQGEYIPPSSDRLRYITGFTGSAGFAIVASKAAVLFTDGRYTVQARSETDPAIYELAPVPAEQPVSWLKATLKGGALVGFDPGLHTLAEIEKLRDALAESRIKLKPVKVPYSCYMNIKP